MKILKNILKKILFSFGLDVRLTNFGRKNPINLSEENSTFLKLYEKVKRNTLLSKDRLFIIFQILQNCRLIDGEMAEIGVYKGGVGVLISEIIKNTPKALHLFDTFEGMPEVNKNKDLHNKGDFSDTSLKDVKALFDNKMNIYFHKGIFPETAVPIKKKKYSFVHVDVDIYQSVIDSCEYFYDRLNKGAVMLFDDYGFLSCPGAKEAVDGFFKEKKESPIYLETGQAFIIKQ